MPSTGFYSFLHFVCRLAGKKGRVSMPSTGFYSFLLAERQTLRQKIQCVNALNGLLLISTKVCLTWATMKQMCQCPQRASTHFYSILCDGLLYNTATCQCPQRASTHFYIEFEITNENKLVSMPSTGFYSFLRTETMKMDLKKMMCQCPQRASTHFYPWTYSRKPGAPCVSMPSTGFYSFLR